MPAAAVVAALTRRRGVDLGAELKPAATGPKLSTGCVELDAAFDGGGLLAGGAHEVSAAEVGDACAAAVFALGLAVRRLQRTPGRRALFVQAAQAGSEQGLLYGPGLHALGLDPDRWLFVTARDDAGVLRVVDEATRSGAPAAVVAELSTPERLDLKTTRRFNLAGQRGGTTALLLTPRPAATSAALSRWRVASARSRGPADDLLGAPTLRLDLTRNRHGRLGAWTVEWNPDDRLFQLATDPVALAASPTHRPFSVGRDQHADHADGGRRAVG